MGHARIDEQLDGPTCNPVDVRTAATAGRLAATATLSTANGLAAHAALATATAAAAERAAGLSWHGGLSETGTAAAADGAHVDAISSSSSAAAPALALR